MATTEVVHLHANQAPSLDTAQPMWIYDCENLRFLAVNEAALREYGYSLNEFLDMTILDIRPLEDVSKLLRHTLDPGFRHESSKERWRHCKKDGTLFEVEITSWGVMFEGRAAEIVLAVPVRLRKAVAPAVC